MLETHSCQRLAFCEITGKGRDADQRAVECKPIIVLEQPQDTDDEEDDEVKKWLDKWELPQDTFTFLKGWVVSLLACSYHFRSSNNNHVAGRH